MLNDSTFDIINQMVSVQPMDSNLLSDMEASLKSEQELLDQGYHPVDNSTKFMWIKDPI